MLDEQRLKIKQYIESKFSSQPKPSSLPKSPVINSRKRLTILLLILVLAIIITGIAAWRLKLVSPNRSFMDMFKEGLHIPSKTSISLSPLPSPRPIPHGKMGFTVGQSDKTVPQFSRGFIDPYDPEKGSTQTVTITVKYKKPVTKVTATLKTDKNISAPVPLVLVDGTNTSGQWQGSWKATDTYLYIYKLILKAESANSPEGSVEITLR
jgi:hypothetical protein